MAKKQSYLTVTDQFCGAGGSSQGVRRFAERAGLGNGVEVRLAMNHWKLALETHATNFPDTDHVATDIQACNPKDYASTDILITSPECTNHSVAKGRKQVKAQLDAFDKKEQDASAERSRATMWDVVRFAEYHKYRIIITENVVDANAWVLIDSWLGAMTVLGYAYKRVFFNSMFAWPTPQSRDRVYFVFWRKGQRTPNLDIRPLAPCPRCGPVNAQQRFKPKASNKAKYGTQYTYVCPRCAKDVMPFYFAAINAIDFSVPAVRIGDRKKPLEARTMQRIAFGLEKYGKRPLTVTNYFSSGVNCRVKDATDAPLFTQHGKAGTAIVAPYLVDTKYSHAGEKRAKSAADPLRAQTGQDSNGVVLPYVVGTEYDDAKRAKGMDDPLAAQTGRATAGVVMPFFMDGSFTKAKGEYMHGSEQPIGTQTTTQSKSVVLPPALMLSAGSAEVDARPVSAPTPTFTGSDRIGVAMTMSLNYPEQQAKPLNEALEVPAKAGMTTNRPMALVSPFLATLRGTDAVALKGTASGLDEPVGTVSAGGIHHALVSGRAMGFLESHYTTGENVRGLDEAMGALSCRDRHGLVNSLPPAPAPADLRIEDLYFRMLKPHEVQAGMAFDHDYQVLGNSREKVKQLGNAVTPPVMEMLVERCIESLM